MRKFFALILAVLLFPALLPVGAFAEEDGMPEGSVIIGQVEIEGFVEPAPGEPFSAQLTVPEDAHYRIEDCGWIGLNEESSFQPDEGDILTDTDAWYFMYIHLRPEEGYAFTDDLIALMNGEPDLFEVISAPAWDMAELLTFDYYFGEEEDDPEEPELPGEDDIYTVEEVYLDGIALPEYMEAPCRDVTVPEGAFYRIDAVEWYRRGEDGEPALMGEEEIFNDTETCYFMRLLLGFYESQFSFADNVEVYTNIDDDDPILYAQVREDGMLEIVTFDYGVYDPDGGDTDPDDPIEPGEQLESDDPDEGENGTPPVPDGPIAPQPEGGYSAVGSVSSQASPPAAGGAGSAAVGLLLVVSGACLGVLRKRRNGPRV